MGIFKRPDQSLVRNTGTSSARVVIGGLSSSDLAKLPSKESLIEERLTAANEELKEYKERSIRAAEHEAGLIIQAAREEAERLRQEQIQVGFEQGLKAAEEKVMQESQAILESLANTMISLEQEKAEILEHEPQQVLEFIGKLAKKIIKRDLTFSTDDLEKIVIASINEVSHISEINLLLEPDSAKLLNEQKLNIQEQIPGIEYLTITANKDLALGDVIVESKQERLDARLDSSFEVILNNLKKDI